MSTDTNWSFDGTYTEHPIVGKSDWYEITTNHGAETVALIPAMRRTGPDVVGGRFISGAGLTDNSDRAKLLAAAPLMIEQLQDTAKFLRELAANQTFHGDAFRITVEAQCIDEIVKKAKGL